MGKCERQGYLELNDLLGPLQAKPFYDSVNIFYAVCCVVLCYGRVERSLYNSLQEGGIGQH